MKYVKQKLPGFKSGINYDDLESEIARLEKERQSAENEHKLVHERLANLLGAKGLGQSGIRRRLAGQHEKIDFKLDVLTQIGRSLPDD